MFLQTSLAFPKTGNDSAFLAKPLRHEMVLVNGFVPPNKDDVLFADFFWNKAATSPGGLSARR